MLSASLSVVHGCRASLIINIFYANKEISLSALLRDPDPMGQDPVFWLAGAVRVLTRRVDELQQLCGSRSKNTEVSDTQLAAKINELLVMRLHDVRQELMREVEESFAHVVAGAGLCTKKDVDNFQQRMMKLERGAVIKNTELSDRLVAAKINEQLDMRLHVVRQELMQEVKESFVQVVTGAGLCTKKTVDVKHEVKAEVESALAGAKPALMREFGQTFALVLREEIAELPAMVAKTASMEVRLAELESKQAGGGMRKRLEWLAKRSKELEDEVRDMGDRLESCEVATNTFWGVAGDVRGYMEEEEKYDDDDEKVCRGETLYEGAYVVVHGVSSRMELNDMVGLLVEYREDKTRWIVRLRTEERVLLKADNLRLFMG